MENLIVNNFSKSVMNISVNRWFCSWNHITCNINCLCFICIVFITNKSHEALYLYKANVFYMLLAFVLFKLVIQSEA